MKFQTLAALLLLTSVSPGNPKIQGPSSSVALQACFSPFEDCESKLGELLKGAKYRIDLAIFDLNLASVAEILVEASKTKKIRVLADRRQAKTEKSQIPYLIERGIEVRFGRQRGIMHNKFVVVDAKTVETGSFNFTNGASRSNSENQVYISDPLVVEKFQSYFDELWRKAGLPKDPRLGRARVH